LLGGVALVLLAIGGIMTWRAVNFGVRAGTTATVTLPEPPAVDLSAAAATLGEAVRIQTVTTVAGDPRPGSEQPWLELRSLLEACYPITFSRTIESVAGHTLLITWPGMDASLPPIVLMAHQDVVPVNPGTEGEWTHGPFAGVVSDGHVWGRGAMDDKGPLIAMLEAAESLARTGWQPARTVILLSGHDEEVSGTGARKAFELLESRGVAPAMVLDEGMVVLTRLPITGKPAALIGVAEKGYLSLELTAETTGGHSSRPPRDSGAVRISRAVVALDQQQMPAHLAGSPFREMIEALATDLPFATRFAFANAWLLGPLVESRLTDPSANALVRTTTAPTMLAGSIKDNVLPQRASAVANFRIHPQDSVASVREHVRQVTRDIPGLEVSDYRDGLASEPSPVSSTSSRAYRVLEAVARDAGGPDLPVAPALMIAATDSRHAVLVSRDAVYRFTPAVYSEEDLDGFHGTNERLSVENLGRMIRAYSQVMLALAGGP
jgi:carboxypeptidase PM20D1